MSSGEDIKVVPNITGVVDLLGFSSHLNLGANDVRTKSGGLAVTRLNFLKDAVSTINKERSKHPEIYPNKDNFFIKRITDSIIVSADIDEVFLPRVGEKFRGVYGMDNLRKLYKKSDNNGQEEISAEKLVKEAGFIIGSIARIHSYINKKEHEEFFPGCRTTITLGLRLPSNDERDVDDMLSANFAFSSSWKANEEGKKSGIKESNLYLENSAASVLRPGTICHDILRSSKFEVNRPTDDPYREQGSYPTSYILMNKIIENKQFDVYLDQLKLTFRKVNPAILSLLQLIPSLDPKKINDDDVREFFNSYSDLCKLSDDEIVKINDFNGRIPFWGAFNLDDNYGMFFSKK